MDELIASTKKEVLVEMVRMAQKKGMKGNKGHWKEFLKSYDKRFGASVCDPSRKPVDSLVAFIKSFEQDDDLKFFNRVLQCHANRDEVELFKKISPDKETPEQRLVRLTLEHPLYPIEYSFPSYEEEWVVVKCLKKSKSMKSTKLLAIDCEMVLCEDGTDALVKVCAVDRNLKVKLHEVVKPNKPVADYRTDITGITAKDLDGVTHSLKDVQISLKKMLSHGTILVGHSVNNDLQALKLDHTKVIDTSYIFKYNNRPTSRKPSLSLLCKAKLGFELRKNGEPHNCVDDACAAMKLALAMLEGKIDDEITEEVKESDLAMLLVHRIPIDILTKDLKSVLPGNCTIEVGKKAIKSYSAKAVFKNQREASEAFENLEGDLEKDSYGRPQKLVNFELNSGKACSVYVVCLLGDTVGQDTKKRSAEDDTPGGVSKKSKTEKLEDPNNECEIHLKEIERLTRELKQRDEEISSQNKIIAALTRKQGL